MEIENQDELYRLLKDSKGTGRKVAIVGTGSHARKTADIIVSTIKMSHFEITGEKVLAQAGAPVAKIREEASSRDLLFPSLYHGTVGGLLATNEPSTISTAYGTPDKFTEWVKIVTPVGVFKWRGFIGSRGLLGGFTEASLKLFPRPSSVISYTSSLDLKEVMKTFEMLISKNPIALLVEYDGKFRIHASFTSAVVEGMESYDGVPVVEESDRGSFMVRSPDVGTFVEIVRTVSPVYAYYIQGVEWSKVYTSDEEGLNRWEHYPSSQVKKSVLRLKAILDHWNVLV